MPGELPSNWFLVAPRQKGKAAFAALFKIRMINSNHLLLSSKPYPSTQHSSIVKRLFFIFTCSLLVSVVFIAGCDTDISGDPFENEAPETQLSVRDTSLADNLAEEDRLTSTVFASWVGDDPDGFVEAFEFRFYDVAFTPGPEEDWVMTANNDTLVLLPIQSGNKVADVVFEVRAIDNEGIKDPTPARTVFPIQNSPPNIQVSSFDLPPDTTFPIFSFAWRATDPDGDQNLDRIEISLNDSVNFVSLPIDADFITFQAQDFGRNASSPTIDSDVFLGRGFVPTDIDVPGLRLDSDNIMYIRSVDATDTTSVVERYTWYVKSSKSDILFVNDIRKNTNERLSAYHQDLLLGYLPAGSELDIWNIAEPFVTGNTGNAPRSDALSPNAVPTMQQFLAQYQYIYWISSASTNSVSGNNFPLAASVMDVFFNGGGKLMVHTPVTAPLDPEANASNASVAILPLNDLTIVPDSVRRISLAPNAAVTKINDLPAVATPLPELRIEQFVVGPLPYVATGASVIPLYEAEYAYQTLRGTSGPWPESNLVASISADQRIGLFSLPLINEQTGDTIVSGADGSDETARDVVRMMLESLGFPK